MTDFAALTLTMRGAVEGMHRAIQSSFRSVRRLARRVGKVYWRTQGAGSRRAWRRSTFHSTPRVRRHGRSQPSRRRG